MIIPLYKGFLTESSITITKIIFKLKIFNINEPNNWKKLEMFAFNFAPRSWASM